MDEAQGEGGGLLGGWESSICVHVGHECILQTHVESGHVGQQPDPVASDSSAKNEARSLTERGMKEGRCEAGLLQSGRLGGGCFQHVFSLPHACTEPALPSCISSY